MSKELLEDKIDLHNKQLAYTDGFQAGGDKDRKRTDSVFPAGTPLGDLWMQGYKDGKKNKKGSEYLDPARLNVKN